MRKNEEYEVEILDFTDMGSGVAKVNNFTVFVEGGLTHDILKILIVKVKKNYAFGKILHIIKPSKNRIEKSIVDNRCSVFSSCGGCSILHMNYSSGVNFKVENLKNLMINIFDKNYINKIMLPVETSNIFNYRNKVIYPVRYEQGIKIGFYKKNSHNVIDYNNCAMQQNQNSYILQILKEMLVNHNISAYNENDRTGIIRNIFIRQGHITNEIMIGIVINDTRNVLPNEFVKSLSNIENVKSIVVNYNTKNTNLILGDKNSVVFGREYIVDFIGDLKFHISIHSFYQINNVLYKRLLDDLIKYTNFEKSENVLDIYCGIGTITLYLSKYVKEIFGIEVVEYAVKNAKENAKINNIQNAHFLLGRAEDISKNFVNKNIKTIILDPPRKGLDENVSNAVLEINPDKIIYISCNPKTLARDLKVFSDFYTIKFLKPYDFFPHTLHIETLTILERKKLNEVILK
ncbi:MAG: 23S rRNA (uracil(1939)-C(5))-methyltransferase RlmD [Defluviitaleaceae bacterium]|nr:23S rRNA (uracil(1939)-C(5))-methyltransferase RlmD [Defluviitaleaceae bacterium]